MYSMVGCPKGGGGIALQIVFCLEHVFNNRTRDTEHYRRVNECPEKEVLSLQ